MLNTNLKINNKREENLDLLCKKLKVLARLHKRKKELVCNLKAN